MVAVAVGVGGGGWQRWVWAVGLREDIHRGRERKK